MISRGIEFAKISLQQNKILRRTYHREIEALKFQRIFRLQLNSMRNKHIHINELSRLKCRS